MKTIKENIRRMYDIVIDYPLYLCGNEITDDLYIKDCGRALAHGGLKFSYKRSPKDTIRLYVKTLTGKTCVIDDLMPADLTEYLKERVEVKEGIPPEQQRLIFAGEQLEDDQMLMSYKIKNESVLHLVLRLRGCACGCLEYDRRIADDITTLYGNIKVALPDGSSIILHVEPVKNTIKDLKTMVHDAELKYQADRIELLFQGKLLKNEVTLQEACIRNKSELVLVPLLGPSFQLKPKTKDENLSAVYDIYGRDVLQSLQL